MDSTARTMSLPLHHHMWGLSEFALTGTLRTYEATPRLKRVKIPTLYTVGEFDEAGIDAVKRFAKLTPGSRIVVIPDAAHVTTWDNPAEMLRVVREFLRDVDSVASATTESTAATASAGQP
jgi:proline iminopeptidase